MYDLLLDVALADYEKALNALGEIGRQHFQARAHERF